MNILLVEDEQKIRQGLKKIIEDVITSKLRVTEASNGREALDWLKTQDQVDLIITDIRMSEMNGIELIKRAKESHPSLLFVVISGYDEFAYAREALRYGVSDYLLKPIERVELAQVLQKISEQINATKQPNQITTATVVNDDKDRLLIRRVKELVNEYLNQDISLQFLAERVYLHPKYLSDMFKRETGQNLSDYVTERRMEKARKLLKETTLKVAEVAMMCGFANHKYFASLFKQHTGCTPSEFREQ
ncbi:putative response regulatory protein [Paenibacillus allorhizoplanae]|uniref:Response regulatory protein n=1 Tax=Paenibacillus allorhizoplanae TaxID=2905648 RepID=A0ABM9CPQ6_9BACL|nr:response regulator [Paenibacillus allorhizoplanae]CAH1220810.1 putative response regulatory protein [Paenibacillus allorhizoplanae]